MTGSYEKALRDAERSVAEWSAKLEEAERKLAQAKLLVETLKRGIGLAPDNIESLTDAIMLVLKAADGYVTAANAVEALFVFGHSAQTASVRTILSRLAKQGKIVALDGSNGTVGYGWKLETTKTEKQAARQKLAGSFTKRRPGSPPSK